MFDALGLKGFPSWIPYYNHIEQPYRTTKFCLVCVKGTFPLHKLSIPTSNCTLFISFLILKNLDLQGGPKTWRTLHKEGASSPLKQHHSLLFYKQNSNGYFTSSKKIKLQMNQIWEFGLFPHSQKKTLFKVLNMHKKKAIFWPPNLIELI